MTLISQDLVTILQPIFSEIDSPISRPIPITSVRDHGVVASMIASVIMAMVVLARVGLSERK